MSNVKVDREMGILLSKKIAKWHTDTSIACALHKYLGMTLQEYTHFVEANEIPEDMANSLRVATNE